MKPEIEALVFDAYGTLFDPYSLRSACDEWFPNCGSNLSRLWRAKQLEYTWLRSLMGHYEDFWRITESSLVFACRSLGLQCGPEVCGRLLDAYLAIEPYPEVREALSTLSNFPLAILSNGTPQMLHAALQKAGLEGVFSPVISVDEVKTYKPSPRVYRLAAEKLDVDRYAIGFISSNYWDVIGAKAFGFWTCWMNRSAAQPDELGLKPDVTVGALKELTNVLSGA